MSFQSLIEPHIAWHAIGDAAFGVFAFALGVMAVSVPARDAALALCAGRTDGPSRRVVQVDDLMPVLKALALHAPFQ